MKPFVGRDNELRGLEDLSTSGRACLVVLKGRRRIGKSRLAEEFGKNKVFLPFSGLAPVKGVSAQDQRDAFAREFTTLFHLPPLTFTNWSDAFAHLSRHLTTQPTVILFDEISWMGTKDPGFISKLKVWWDLEQIQAHQSADENIKRLCFEKNGLLVHEFDRIFNDLFSVRGEIYKKIITCLSQGMKDRTTLQQAMAYSPSGTLSNHLKALEICGFVSKHPDWSLKTGKTGKRTLYQLSDNYLRFYIHYIEPHLTKIEQSAFLELPLSSLPGWEPMLGFQLENLLLKNRALLYRALGIHAQDVIMDNPYVQKAAGRKKGCPIDYLIQMHSNTLFVCEVKMRRRELGLEVIDAMKTKIASLTLPKGFEISPVLLHLGPLSDALLSSRYFYRIIDTANL